MALSVNSAFAIIATVPTGTQQPSVSDFVSPANFNIMQPFMTPPMQQRLYPGGTSIAPNPTAAWSQISTGSNITPASAFAQSAGRNQVRSAQRQQTRQVVARPVAANVSRAATATGVSSVNTETARASGTQTASAGRQVVARSGITSAARSVSQRPVANTRASTTTARASSVPTTRMSAEQCLSGYRACMDGYCERTNAAYNRCYCSARLAQVDAAFKPAIEDILQQIVIAQGGRDNYLTDEELEDLWQGTFFQHVGINDMASLNEKLSSINWADTESRVRGQNAFVVGHEWCTQHLTGCYYMASQLRDAYRSEIARDCGTYEKYLEAMKLVAEQALASFE